MSISYRIDPSAGVIFTNAQGAVTAQDTFTFQRALMDDPDFDPTFKHLVDTNQVTQFEVSAATILKLYFAEMFTEGTRRAVVVPENQSAQLKQLYNIVHDFRSEDLQAIHKLDEALLWLQL